MSLSAVSEEILQNRVVIFGGSETAHSIQKLVKQSFHEEEGLILFSENSDLKAIFQKTDSISLAIFDGDDENISTLELAHSLEFKDSATRMVIISGETPSVQKYREIINSNLIHELATLKEWEEDIDLRITRHVADFFVIRMMEENLIKELEDENLLRSYSNEFVGFIMTNFSLVKYAILKDVKMREEEILIGSYLGSVLDMIQSTESEVQSNYSFKLGNLEIISEQVGEIGYFFLFKDLSPRYREQISKTIEQVIGTMVETVGTHFLDPNIIGDEDIGRIEIVLNNYNLIFDRDVKRLEKPTILTLTHRSRWKNIVESLQDVYRVTFSSDFEELLIKSTSIQPEVYLFDLEFVDEELVFQLSELITIERPNLQMIYILVQDDPEYLSSFLNKNYNVYVLLPSDKDKILEDILMNVSSSVITHQFSHLDVVPKLPGMNIKSYLSMAYRNLPLSEYNKELAPDLVASRFIYQDKVIYEMNKFPDLDIFNEMDVAHLSKSLKEFGQHISDIDYIYSMKIKNSTVIFIDHFTFSFIFILNNLHVNQIEKVGALVNEHVDMLSSILMSSDLNDTPDSSELDRYMDDLAFKICSMQNE